MKKQLVFVRDGSHGIENIVVLEFTLSHVLKEQERSITTGWLRDQLIGAVTAWIEGSPEGDEAWRNSCEDLNIGDLVRDGFESLKPFLRSHAIQDVEVVFEYSFDSDYVKFDLCLNAKA